MTGREPVAEFVQQWLARSFPDGSNYTVRVHFPGEAPPPDVALDALPEPQPLLPTEAPPR